MYIVTIVLKYWKRGFNNNNNILCILLLDTVVLSTETSCDLMLNGEALVYGVIGDCNKTWSVLKESRYIWICLLLSGMDGRCHWLVYDNGRLSTQKARK